MSFHFTPRRACGRNCWGCWSGGAAGLMGYRPAGLRGVHQHLCKLLLFNTLQSSRWTVATKNREVSMMHFISCCNSKCYENTDGQPGGHRSRRGRGPRMAWPPCAPQPSEMAGDPDGRVRGRGPQAKRSGKDSPEGAYQPRPPACRRLPDGRERALPPRHPSATPRRDLRKNGKGR